MVVVVRERTEQFLLPFVERLDGGWGLRRLRKVWRRQGDKIGISHYRLRYTFQLTTTMSRAKKTRKFVQVRLLIIESVYL
jgi:hypothetical protein